MHSAVKIAKRFIDKNQCTDMTPMKLLKLVYIAHGWMLGLYSRPLISEDVEAWKYGPVIPELYREIKSYRSSPVPHERFAAEHYAVKLDEQEENIIDQVYNKYKDFGGVELSAMTHAPGTPWHQTWHSKDRDLIPDELIQEYYRNLSGYGADEK